MTPYIVDTLCIIALLVIAAICSPYAAYEALTSKTMRRGFLAIAVFMAGYALLMGWVLVEREENLAHFILTAGAEQYQRFASAGRLM